MRQVQSIHSVAFAMAISLTLFACSDSSSGDDNEVSSSSSELNEESSSSVEELSSSSSELNEESSSSAEDLSSSSEAESSSSEAESSSSEVYSSSSFDGYWNPNIEYGTLNDDRDGKAYRTVVIGTQVWMAENLNYTPESGNSWCYGYRDKPDNCDIYGRFRLYDWTTANTVCPTGWHLPSDAEWTVLASYVGDSSTKLKANSSLWGTNTGTDDYGFSALPGAYRYGDGASSVGYLGYWWTATEDSDANAYRRSMYYGDGEVGSEYSNKLNGFGVRCVQD